MLDPLSQIETHIIQAVQEKYRTRIQKICFQSNIQATFHEIPRKKPSLDEMRKKNGG